MDTSLLKQILALKTRVKDREQKIEFERKRLERVRILKLQINEAIRQKYYLPLLCREYENLTNKTYRASEMLELIFVWTKEPDCYCHLKKYKLYPFLNAHYTGVCECPEIPVAPNVSYDTIMKELRIISGPKHRMEVALALTVHSDGLQRVYDYPEKLNENSPITSPLKIDKIPVPPGMRTKGRFFVDNSYVTP